MKIIIVIFVALGLMWINYPQTAYSIGVALSFQSVELHNTIEMQLKECTNCGMVKRMCEFAIRNDRSIGYESHCKQCKKLASIARGRTELGVIKTIYRGQIYTSKKRGHSAPMYNIKELTDWLYQNGFKHLYNNWVSLGYKKELKPSVDRMNDSIGYCISNIRLVTFGANNKRSHMQMRDGTLKTNFPQKEVWQYDLQGNLINKFNSLSSASRGTKIGVRMISRVYKGYRSHTHGFVFTPPKRSSE